MGVTEFRYMHWVFCSWLMRCRNWIGGNRQLAHLWKDKSLVFVKFSFAFLPSFFCEYYMRNKFLLLWESNHTHCLLPEHQRVFSGMAKLPFHIFPPWLFLDMNECLTNPCAIGQICINTAGSFRCQRETSCGTGYELTENNLCKGMFQTSHKRDRWLL